MSKRKKTYPATKEAEKQRSAQEHKQYEAEEPDMIDNAPNYDKFTGWTAEEVLVFLNID